MGICLGGRQGDLTVIRVATMCLSLMALEQSVHKLCCDAHVSSLDWLVGMFLKNCLSATGENSSLLVGILILLTL